jgi:hypothetical protein
MEMKMWLAIFILILIPEDGPNTCNGRDGGYRDDAAPRWLRVSRVCMMRINSRCTSASTIASPRFASAVQLSHYRPLASFNS